MVGFGYIIVNVLHKGDNKDNNNNNRRNNVFLYWDISLIRHDFAHNMKDKCYKYWSRWQNFSLIYSVILFLASLCQSHKKKTHVRSQSRCWHRTLLTPKHLISVAENSHVSRTVQNSHVSRTVQNNLTAIEYCVWVAQLLRKIKVDLV